MRSSLQGIILIGWVNTKDTLFVLGFYLNSESFFLFDSKIKSPQGEHSKQILSRILHFLPKFL